MFFFLFFFFSGGTTPGDRGKKMPPSRFVTSLIGKDPPWRQVVRRFTMTICSLSGRLVADEVVDDSNRTNSRLVWHRELPPGLRGIITVLWFISPQGTVSIKSQQMSDRDVTAYRSVCAALLYVCMSRLDLAFECFCLRKGNPLFRSYDEAGRVNKLIQLARDTRAVGIRYPVYRGPHKRFRLLCFHDAAIKHVFPHRWPVPAELRDVPVGGMVAGWVPEDWNPVHCAGDVVQAPFYIVDWLVYSATTVKDVKSYKAETRVLTQIREYAAQLAIQGASTFGFSRKYIMIGDTLSAIAKGVNDGGMNYTDPMVEDLASLREAYFAGEFDTVFVNGDYNYADLFTKPVSRSGEKFVRFLEILRTGILSIPKSAFAGRSVKNKLICGSLGYERRRINFY